MCAFCSRDVLVYHTPEEPTKLQTTQSVPVVAGYRLDTTERPAEHVGTAVLIDMMQNSTPTHPSLLYPRPSQALESMVLELCGVLAGKSGVLSQWYQRHSCFMALEGVRRGVESAQMPESRSAELAIIAVDGLLPAVEKESHEDTLAVGLGCLTRWALWLDVMPPKFLQSLKNGVRSAARPTAIIFAGAACELSGSPRLCAQLATLVPDLLGRVELAAKKSNSFHPDAIFGAKVVLEIATADAAWTDRVNEAFPWAALMDQGSFVFPSGVLAPQFADVGLAGEAAGPLLPHVCTALCRVISLAARSLHGHARAGVEPFPEASSFALMQCMVLPSRVVRQVAIEASLDVCNLLGGAQAALLGSCQQVRDGLPL